MMHGREKSDSAIVAVKPTNKAVPGRSDDVRSPGQTESYRRRVKTALLTHLGHTRHNKSPLSQGE
jgi:hypothetical protein